MNIEDVHAQLEIEKKDSSEEPRSPQSEPEDKILVSFRHDDLENPHNWSFKKKIYVVLLGVVLVMESTIGSSIASGTPEEISQYFDIQSQELLVLPISLYLVGYVLGPLAFGPLSEHYGRKWILIYTFVCISFYSAAVFSNLRQRRSIPSSP